VGCDGQQDGKATGEHTQQDLLMGSTMRGYNLSAESVLTKGVNGRNERYISENIGVLRYWEFFGISLVYQYRWAKF
jgi:hypothetical protein